MSDNKPSSLSPGEVIIDPPSDRLMRKAPLIDGDLEKALRQTELVVAKLGESYPQRLARDCADIKRLALDFRKSLSPDAMEKVRFLAHDMKGQGGQFGYGLVTVICDSLQKHLKPILAPGPRTADIVDVHVEALLLVESGRMTGDGGKEGAVLVDNLSKLAG